MHSNLQAKFKTRLGFQKNPNQIQNMTWFSKQSKPNLNKFITNWTNFRRKKAYRVARGAKCREPTVVMVIYSIKIPTNLKKRKVCTSQRAQLTKPTPEATTSNAKPNQTNQNRIKPNQTKQCQTKQYKTIPNNTKPNQSMPNPTKPNKSKQNKTKQCQTKQCQTKPNQTKQIKT